MRGAFRAVLTAAMLAQFAGAAVARDAPSPAPVAFRLATGEAVPSAEVIGTPFASAFAEPFGAGFASGYVVERQGLAAGYGPPSPRAINLRDFAGRFSLSTSLALDLGYKLDAAGDFRRVDFSTDPTVGLLGVAPVSPLGVAGASYLGATWAVDDRLRLHAGGSLLARDDNPTSYDAFALFGEPIDRYGRDLRQGNAVGAGASWNFARWGAIDLGASQANEREGLLGETPLAQLSTSAVNVSAHLKFGDGWVTTASYGEGLTKLDIKPSALASLESASSDLRRSGYAIAVAKHGLFGDDTLGLAVSQPIAPQFGAGAFATFAGSAQVPSFVTSDHLLADVKPETDIEVGYVTNFLDGAVALQTNAAFQMNFAGQNGNNALTLQSKAKIKF